MPSLVYWLSSRTGEDPEPIPKVPPFIEIGCCFLPAREGQAWGSPAHASRPDQVTLAPGAFSRRGPRDRATERGGGVMVQVYRALRGLNQLDACPSHRFLTRHRSPVRVRGRLELGAVTRPRDGCHRTGLPGPPPALPVEPAGQEDLTDVVRFVGGRAQEQLRRIVPATLPREVVAGKTLHRSVQITMQHREFCDRSPQPGKRPAGGGPCLVDAGVLAPNPLHDVSLPVDDVVDLLPHRVSGRGSPGGFREAQTPDRRSEPLVGPISAASRVL